MKIIYSEIKKLLPGLDRPIEKLAQDLTLIGHFVDGLEKKGEESIISLEIRQNRADCLGYWGIAKDLAAFYNLTFKNPQKPLPAVTTSKKLPLQVEAKNQVKRIMAIKIGSLKNRPSPDWLKKFLKLHDINSINTLVDLTNYIMLLWGIPNHAFDAQKSTDNLVWEVNQGKFTQFTSFDGSKITLKKGVLQISNQKKVLSLAGIVGSKNSGVSLDTKEAIVEMAIYDPAKVRKDSKNLKVVTEASLRLEKQLDINLIPQAFNHLINLILTNCQGKILSSVYNYYPKEKKLQEKKQIKFHPRTPSLIAGVDIENRFCLKTLQSLGCLINHQQKEIWLITPPSHRTDLELEEDLAEEVIRFWGYQNIPTNQPISAEILPEITPQVLHLIKAVKNILVNLGYDEVRSWPLIKKSQFIKAGFLPKEAKAIYTQNNINDQYPLLRASICSCLKAQNQQYQKLKVPQRRFFEIGKIFYQNRGKYLERWSLGVFDQDPQRLAKRIKIFYHDLGLLKTKKETLLESKNGAMVEIDLNQISKSLKKVPKIDLQKPPQLKDRSAKELTKQIINLDANLVFKEKKDPKKLIKKYQKQFDPKFLWQLVVLDVYQDKEKYKYTLRAFYYNCSAKKAKTIHRKVFKLKSNSQKLA